MSKLWLTQLLAVIPEWDIFLASNKTLVEAKVN